MKGVGHFVLSAVSSGEEGAKSAKSPIRPAPSFAWAFSNERPNFPNGGMRLPGEEDGSYSFDPLHTFSACKAVTLGDEADSFSPDPRKNYREIARDLRPCFGPTAETRSRELRLRGHGSV